MFTPPPSPQPPPKLTVQPTNGSTGYFDATAEKSPSFRLVPSSDDTKRVIGRRTKWAVLFVPLALILITASTRYLTHPIAMDVLSNPSSHSDWHVLSDWRPHKRHPSPDNAPSGTSPPTGSTVISFPSTVPSGTLSSSSSTPSPTLASNQALPTIPSSAPALPTPFPQPLDALDQNFSTQACYNFFLNMTNTASFRSCRPFSLLLQSSEEFIQAQDNVTGLNDILWGTCNTDLSADQCNENMADFASQLQSTCATDISDKNSMAVSTLIGLQTYTLMRSAGCSADPMTNTYCYMEAVHDTNPSDLYFFQLPLGIALPNNTTPSCSSCTQSLLSLYAPSMHNVTGLKDTYPAAAALAGGKCGQGYAPTQAAEANAAWRVSQRGLGTAAVALILTVAVMSI